MTGPFVVDLVLWKHWSAFTLHCSWPRTLFQGKQDLRLPFLVFSCVGTLGVAFTSLGSFKLAWIRLKLIQYFSPIHSSRDEGQRDISKCGWHFEVGQTIQIFSVEDLGINANFQKKRKSNVIKCWEWWHTDTERNGSDDVNIFYIFFSKTFRKSRNVLLLLQNLYLQQQYPWKCKSLTLKEVVMESVEQGKELAMLMLSQLHYINQTNPSADVI